MKKKGKKKGGTDKCFLGVEGHCGVGERMVRSVDLGGEGAKKKEKYEVGNPLGPREEGAAGRASWARNTPEEGRCVLSRLRKQGTENNRQKRKGKRGAKGRRRRPTKIGVWVGGGGKKAVPGGKGGYRGRKRTSNNQRKGSPAKEKDLGKNLPRNLQAETKPAAKKLKKERAENYLRKKKLKAEIHQDQAIFRKQ